MSDSFRSVVDSCLNKRRMKGEWSISQTIQIAGAIGTQDLLIARRKKRLQIAAGSVWLLLFAAGLYVWDRLDSGWMLFGTLLGTFAGTVLTFYRIHKRFSALDIADEVRLMLTPLLDAIRNDVRKGAPLSVDVDLEPLIQDRFASKKNDSTVYRRDVLSLVARLQDGNRLGVHVSESVSRKERTKRSSSGKTKKKVKVKAEFTYVLRLSMDAKRFQSKWNIDGQKRNGSLMMQRTGGKGTVIGLKHEESQAAVNPAGQGFTIPPPAMLLRKIVELYTCIEPVPPASPEKA